MPIDDEWLDNNKTTTKNKLHWNALIRTGTAPLRSDSPNLFNSVAIIFDDSEYIPQCVQGCQWKISSHDSSRYGTNLIISANKFAFPKSLYAVRDCLKFFVANKPDALIIDFFAGSWTTAHAVNLLNAEDGWARRCIMVTNN